MNDLHQDPAGGQPGGSPPGSTGEGGTKRLDGRVALITGGGTGIGRSIALLFAGEGARVVVAGRRSDPLQQTVQAIRQAGGTATFAKGDVAKADMAELIVHSAVYNFGGLDILVNSAAIFLPGSVESTNERRWDRLMGANLKGPYLVSRLAVPAMRARGGGSIVNVAGMAGLAGQRDAAAFAASKGGLLALTRSMALDHAEDRIRVNAICPGAAREPAGGGAVSIMSAEGQTAVTGAGALASPVKPSDAAHLALYLASGESSGVTGAIFAVDGGAEAA